METRRQNLLQLFQALPAGTREMINRSIESIVTAKEKGRKVVVVTGSGPNLHEGVTTLIAELIRKEIIDGVTTSSAVVAHEMAGVLDQVKRVDGRKLGFSSEILPRGNVFEITLLTDAWLAQLQSEMLIDLNLMQRALALDGSVIIKAAGNMGYPMGLRTENLAKEILYIARSANLPFETVAGAGADSRTMLGAAFLRKIPCLVTVPQLIGGGMVGVALADTISITERTWRIARMLESADVIIESAVALTQEIHDGPFETYTGHGIWTRWEGSKTYSLADKTLIRIDLDTNLQRAWEIEKNSDQVQKAIDQGAPKTKLFSIPFRMEMSGFARLEKSIPVIGDIGVIWPILAAGIEARLGLSLDFISAPQQTPEGQEMRNWIVQNVQPIEKHKLYLA